MLDIHPLTPDRWDDFARLFGPQGACYGCWCTYFRLAPKDRQARTGDSKRDWMKARAEAGPPPGLIGYLDGAPVAWVQVGPRPDVPEFNNRGRVSAPPDPTDAVDRTAWAVSCFFTASKARGQGHSHSMVSAAIRHAREQGARILDACPMRRSKQSRSVGLFVGSERVFIRTGFETIAERKEGRPLMRLHLAQRAVSSDSISSTA